MAPTAATAPIAAAAANAAASERRRINRGLWLATLGIVIFAMTLPMTRLAVGDASAPQLPPGFVTAGRAAVAGLLSLLFLLATRAPPPPRVLWLPMAISALGTVVGFPLGLSMALRDVPSMHAAVVTGVLPLATAVFGAIAARQRPSAGFWACALLGCGLVLAFAVWQGGGALGAADAWLALAVLSAAAGYVGGARASQAMPAQQVICWILLACLPLTLLAAALTWPTQPLHSIRASAWLGFGYAALFSMWLGFFAWYRGLALGGVVRVSQVQLLQPFLALLFAVPVLGERLDAVTLAFSLLVIAVVFLGRRLSVGTPVRP